MKGKPQAVLAVAASLAQMGCAAALQLAVISTDEAVKSSDRQSREREQRLQDEGDLDLS